VAQKRNLLSLALASALLGFFSVNQAFAQSSDDANSEDEAKAAAEAAAEEAAAADDEMLDAVIVTGIRGAIESSTNIKKNQTSIVESITAEDIGKLPDQSIAESIARLPGLSAQRVAGRAQVISVRGLSPDFATTLLNGRELVSTGDNRSVEFDQYPSELISGVTIYKTPDSGIVGQGLSGTIDMRTVRPLDVKDSVFVIGARAQDNSLGSASNASGTGNRINMTYIGKSESGNFGYALGISRSDTPIQENQVGLYEPWEPVGAGNRPGVAAGTFYSNGIKALRRTGYTERTGVLGTLQLRASESWMSTLDLFYTTSEQEDTANQFEVNLGDYNGGFTPGLNLTNVSVNANRTFIGGTANNVYPLVRGIYNKREDNIKAFGWTNEFFLGDIALTADINWSKADREELSLENNTQRRNPTPQLDSVNLSFRNNGFSQLVPGRNYSNPADLFLDNTIYGSGYGKVPSVEDELTGIKLLANLPAPEYLSLFTTFDVGINRAERDKSKRQPEGNIDLGAQGPTAIGSQFQYRPVDLSFAGLGLIPSWNVPGAVAQYMRFAPRSDLDYLIPKAWDVNEVITSAWVRANIDTTLGDVPVRGNVGVQAQHVDQSSQANYFDRTRPVGQQVLPIGGGKTYTDYLPSLNLSFELAENQQLRMGLARQVARPRVDQLRAALEFGVNTATGEPGGGGGNPLLDPWVANAFDLSWERYFEGNKGYVAAAFFYKDLRSYIYTQTRGGYDFQGLLSGFVPQPGTPPVQRFGNFTAPVNGEGGALQGLELTASVPLEMLTESLSGFGVVANASFYDSNIKIRDPESASSVGGGDIDLPGLSDRVLNLTAYYENDGFEARLSQRRRSDFIGEIGNFNGARTLRYVVGESITDAQVSYAFKGGLEGLSVLLQASNLTDESYRTYAGTKDRPLEYIEWGRTYLLGINYKL
jgi:iron complex outermembrane recepter protein